MFWTVVAQDIASWQPAVRETVQIGHCGLERYWVMIDGSKVMSSIDKVHTVL